MSVGLLIQHVIDSLVALLEMSSIETRHGTMLQKFARDCCERRISPERKVGRFKLLAL